MSISVDVWLRGTDVATTESFEGPAREPQAWTDEDVRQLLEGMLRAMERRGNPADPERGIVLRGLSWIVNPFEDGGVLVAIEITLGAAIAGPFDIDKGALEAMIARVLAVSGPSSPTVH
jgi:hypothetical protein